MRGVLALAVILSAALLIAAGTTSNATVTNATMVNITKTNATLVNATAPVVNATTANATEIYFTTPSGNIHLVYASNSSVVVINFNKNKVLTVNIKTTIYNGTTAYYIHLVGHALGNYNGTYVSSLLSKLASALASGNQSAALAALKQLGAYIAGNETKHAEFNLMLTAKSLNSTKPNATFLKVHVEYEVEKRLAAANGTSSRLEVEALASNLTQLAALLNAMSKELASMGINASGLQSASAYLANLSTTLKELEVKLANGTKIEIHRTGHGYKVEISTGEHEEGKHGGGDHHEEQGGVASSKGEGHNNTGGGHSDKDKGSAGGPSKNAQSNGSNKNSGDSGGDDSEED
ncbi:MAG: hypothetical protein TU35_006825 [Thermoproteus sp. AZ2]|jgi:hypothetical protein|uniref:Uncharacterized protein n=1 Tax=Thermoproteus sp. AZ2 TaxID=1609232 RepID=A0ACC6V2K2_9CREN